MHILYFTHSVHLLYVRELYTHVKAELGKGWSQHCELSREY